MERGLLTLADDSCKRGQYAPAVATYLHVISSLPVSGEQYCRVKSSLVTALNNWAQVLHQNMGSFQLLMKGYQEALKICPAEEYLLNDFGALLFRLVCSVLFKI
jgi:hypothetical protein